MTGGYQRPLMSGPDTDGGRGGERRGGENRADGGDDGIVATVGAEPTAHCPAASLAADRTVAGFVPGDDGNAPKFVVETDDEDGLDSRSGVSVTVHGDDLAVCTVPSLADPDPDACGHEHCLGRGLGFVPVQPYRRRWQNGRLLLDVAATDRRVVERTVERLRTAGYEATTERIVRGGVAADGDTALVELRSLTERQREVAAYATARGYFDPDGPSAAALAEEFDIAPATLSEHLRTAETAVFEQVFDER